MTHVICIIGSILITILFMSPLLLACIILSYVIIYYDAISESTILCKLHNIMCRDGLCFKLIKGDDKSEEKNMYTFHPHGITCLGFCRSHSDIHFHKTTFLVSSAMFCIPFYGLIFKLLNFDSITNSNVKRYMDSNKSIAILPGGFEEATICKYDTNRVYINKRKGFIKYALRYGYKVTPVYTFGEEKTYKTYNMCENIRLFLNKLKLPTAIFRGKYILYPYLDSGLTTVIGEALILPIIPNPTDEDIDDYHDLYKEKLKKLFDDNVDKYGKSTKELVFY